jgi:predicted porin
MNKTLIAAAVSAALMAPVAAQADVTLYGRVHQGIQIVNPAMGDSTTDFVGIGSRFGIKASSDLGNGLSASARYEFGVISDQDKNDDNVSIDKTRIATVGLSGPFGSVNLGNQWGAYYNIAGVYMDPTFNVGWRLYSSVVGGPYRSANTIKYSNSFGPVSIELDSRIDDSDDGDGFAVGANFALTDNLSIAIATDDDNTSTVTGAHIKASFGNYWASIASQKNDKNNSDADPSSTHIWVGGSFGENTSVFLGSGSADRGGSGPGNDPSEIILGIYHSLGGGLGLLYEGISYDADDYPGGDSGTTTDWSSHLFGIRLDF